MERMNAEAKAGMKLLQQGYYSLKLIESEEKVPVLVLVSERGELRLKMASIYQQAFRARLDDKA